MVGSFDEKELTTLRHSAGHLPFGKGAPNNGYNLNKKCSNWPINSHRSIR